MREQQVYSQVAHGRPIKCGQIFQSGDSLTKTKMYSSYMYINYYSIQHERQLTFIKTQVYNIKNNKNQTSYN